MITKQHLKLSHQLLILAILMIIFLPSFLKNINFASQPMHFNDDARIFLPAIYHYHVNSNLKNDYISKYCRALMPIGYKAFYYVSSKLVHPKKLSKILTYALITLTIFFLTYASFQLFGTPGGYATLALCLICSQHILQYSGGGLPRSFGFFPITVTILALINEKPYLLAITVIITAAFYPPIAFLIGVTLAIYLFLPYSLGGFIKEEFDGKWSFFKKMMVLFGVVFLSLAILSPTILALKPYGSSINPQKQKHLKAFPERIDRQPMIGNRDVSVKSPLKQSFRFALSTMGTYDSEMFDQFLNNSQQKTLFGIFILIVILGNIVIWIKTNVYKRFLIIIYGIYVCCFLSILMYPNLYYPSRYLIFSLPLLLVISIPTAFMGLSILFYKEYKPKILLIAMVLTLLIFGNTGPTDHGFNDTVPIKDNAIIEYINTLHDNTTFIGWPNDELINNIPYISNKSVLLNFETHICFHKNYVLEMRKRWKLLNQAYFDQDSASLSKLKNEYGVTHVIYNKDYIFGRVEPGYFKSLSHDIKAFPKEFNISKTKIIFEDKHYIISKI